MVPRIMALVLALAMVLAAPVLSAADEAEQKQAALEKQSMALELAAMGEAAHRQGQYAKALKYYNESLASGALPKGDRAGILSNRGSALKALDKTDRALADFDQAIKMNPSLFIAYNNRGQIYFDRGQMEKALTDYGKAIQLKPDYPSPYFNRSLVWEELGDPEKALKDAYRFKALSPGHPWAQKRIDKLQKAVKDSDREAQGGGSSGGKKAD